MRFCRTQNHDKAPSIPAKSKLGLRHHGGKNAKTGELSAASSLIQLRYIKEL